MRLLYTFILYFVGIYVFLFTSYIYSLLYWDVSNFIFLYIYIKLTPFVKGYNFREFKSKSFVFNFVKSNIFYLEGLFISVKFVISSARTNLLTTF